MERDSLLAHGAAYLLHDRLHACSDYSVMDVCSKCGSLVAPLNKPHAAASAMAAGLGPVAAAQMAAMAAEGGGAMVGRVVCPVCSNSSRHIERVAMPYVFKYLATELASMNIKLSIETR
jgi:DNA-directed RNA polymerase I subunit RPA2